MWSQKSGRHGKIVKTSLSKTDRKQSVTAKTHINEIASHLWAKWQTKLFEKIQRDHITDFLSYGMLHKHPKYLSDRKLAFSMHLLWIRNSPFFLLIFDRRVFWRFSRDDPIFWHDILKVWSFCWKALIASYVKSKHHLRKW